QALDCLKNAKTEADRKECNYSVSSKLLNFLMLTF
ncbi:CagY family CD-EC repeat-containing protein, partial [Helicobacter pylori]